MENPEELYTYLEACKYLRIGLTRLKKAKKNGEVRACHVGRVVRFKRNDLDMACSPGVISLRTYSPRFAGRCQSSCSGNLGRVLPSVKSYEIV
jgi:excisionase family DNA binding protein